MVPLVQREVLDPLVHKDLEVKLVSEVYQVYLDLKAQLEQQVDVVNQENRVQLDHKG